jgi:hypothetical protein
MTPEQAATLKELAKAAYELDAFKPNLRRAEAELRVGRPLAPPRRRLQQQAVERPPFLVGQVARRGGWFRSAAARSSSRELPGACEASLDLCTLPPRKQACA